MLFCMVARGMLFGTVLEWTAVLELIEGLSR